MSYPTVRGSGTHATRETLRRELSSGFRRAVGLTLLGTVVPGAGLTQTRSRRMGWAVLLLSLTGALLALYYLLSKGVTNAVLSVVARPSVLMGVGVVLLVGGILWCVSIILTAVQSRPARLDRTRTRFLAAFTTLLVFGVASSSFKVAEYVSITQSTVSEVFGATPLKPGQGAQVAQGEDPWAKQARVNILLIGSDAGVGRKGTRSDSMIVASIDTKTGRTALISLPRNLEKAPLPEDSPLRAMWPSGVYGEPRCPRKERDSADPCALNAVWAETDEYAAKHPGAFTDPVPGREETRDVIGKILGLKMDQTVVVDLKGFSQLIDAMGGLDVNVKNAADGSPLPIGGSRDANGVLKTGSIKGYFKAGFQHLTGWESLWYARSRAADDDTHRQMRQRCVVQAVVQQVNPVEMVGEYPRLAQILKENIYTDIPAQSLPAFVELVLRAKKAKMTTMGLTASQGVTAKNPDYDLVRELVQKALDPPATTPTKKPSKPTKTSTPTPSPTTTPYEQC